MLGPLPWPGAFVSVTLFAVLFVACDATGTNPYITAFGTPVSARLLGGIGFAGVVYARCVRCVLDFAIPQAEQVFPRCRSTRRATPHREHGPTEHT